MKPIPTSTSRFAAYEKAKVANIALRVTEMEQVLIEAILILEREAKGFLPVFALDYDVVHPYLFPTFIGARPRVPPPIASTLIEDSDARLALPPGTVSELIDFCKMLRRIGDGVAKGGRGVNSLGRQELDELLEYYRRFIDPTCASPATAEELNRVLPARD